MVTRETSDDFKNVNIICVFNGGKIKELGK